MRNFKHLGLLTILFACVTVVKAQSSLTVDASQLYSTFKFVDSDNTVSSDEYKGIFTGAYGFGYRYAFENGLTLHSGIGMRTGGASLVIDESNYSWRLQYGEYKLGAGYLYDMGRFSPYFNVSGYLGYMIRGYQTLNNEDFNIIESDLLNRVDYGVMFSPGCQVKLSDFISAYGQFSYLWGLQNIENDENQESGNRAYMLTLGLAFSITDLK